MTNDRRRPPWLRRQLSYLAVTRPSVVFGLIILYVPLTYFTWVPGNSMLGNLFDDYTYGWGFWLGFALFGAVWAVMLTTGLLLDGERDRADSWVYDPAKHDGERCVSIPLKSVRTFFLFTLLGAPSVAAASLRAEGSGRGIAVFAGCLLGGLLAYLCMDLVASLIRCDNPEYQVFPWAPVLFALTAPRLGRSRVEKLGRISAGFSAVASPTVRALGAAPHIFKDAQRPAVRDDHLFAAVSLVGVTLVYWVVYRILKPDSWTMLVDIHSLPPAGFLYALLLPLIWIVSATWLHLRRYRVTLALALLVEVCLFSIAAIPWVESKVGGPAHSYALHDAPAAKPLEPGDVLSPLALRTSLQGEKPTLILVAASGGGILAAGWTTKVLSELSCAHPPFWRDLRLVSAVSGGSVGTAHFVKAFADGRDPAPPSCETLRREIVGDAMKSSLAVTAYGMAFPDFRRVLMPIGADETFDRGRLLEADWRATAKRRHPSGPPDLDLLSAWREAIRQGRRPAVIFNTTVMETGERVAITPISTLRRAWPGWPGDDSQPDAKRRNYARTLPEFLGTGDGCDVDLWTATRLSATFAYVSPAARAAFPAPGGVGDVARCVPGKKQQRNGGFHLIDGGYHDNYGVASALDWLVAALESQDPVALPFDRIALIEIRARPSFERAKPSGQLAAAWVGPVLGIMNSWDFAQVSANDSAVSRLGHIKARYQVRIESFVFVPQGNGPLSWHLSSQQKDFVLKSWECEGNQRALAAFLEFVNHQTPRGEIGSQEFPGCPKG